MSNEQPRHPAGVPTGGQFATAPRPESGTHLAAPEGGRVDKLVHLAQWSFPALDGSEEQHAISRVEAAREARRLLPDLSDDEFYNRHWFGVESAAMQAQRFEADEDGEEADGAAPGDTLDVDLHDFMSVNGPDRAGEADYVGYDFPAYAAAITEAWRTELRRRVAAAVEANGAAALRARSGAA